MTPTASVFTALADAYETAIVDTGKQAQLLLLVSFLASFGFIRTSTHLIRDQVRWWPGNVQVKGTHVHHMVIGILLMLVLGYTAIGFEPDSPWREVLAVGFGIGMGLTLDEFALWLDLRDVYWLPEGRKSIDAVIITAAGGGLLLLGVGIWVDLADRTETALKLLVSGSAGFGFLFAALNALRGRYGAAAASLAIPLVGLVLVLVRPPRPHSIWERVATARPRRA